MDILMYELLFEEFVTMPMKVLVVELKGIAGNKKGSKRTKVKEQLQNSMAAWRKKRPLDEIWGCIYTNETKWEKLIRFDEVKVEPKLNFELVPRGAWGKNCKASIPLQLWKTLLEEYKARTKNRCDLCKWKEEENSTGHLVLHQRWITRHPENDKELLFVGFQLLCWQCHDCCHYGWARIEGRSQGAKEQLAAVNGWNEKFIQFEWDLAGQKWAEDSKIDLTKITNCANINKYTF